MFDSVEYLANACELQEKTIGRRIHSSEISFVKYNNDGTFTKHSVNLFGTFTPERAQRFLRRAYKTQNIIVEGVKHTSKYFAMTINDFIKNATSISD